MNGSDSDDECSLGIRLLFFRLWRFETCDMSFQFVQFCPALKIEADHFEGSLGWRATGIDEYQQASDDRHVSLNLDAVLPGAQEMAASLARDLSRQVNGDLF